MSAAAPVCGTIFNMIILYIGIIATVLLVLFGISYSLLGYNMRFQDWIIQHISAKAMKENMKEENAIRGKRVWVPHRGRDTRVNVYRPQTDEILPAVFFAHGSDFTDGDADEWDDFCLSMSEELNCVLFSVSYTKIGVHVSTYPQTEIVESVRWFRQHSAEYGFDKNNFLMMGIEAGAYLSLIAALHLIQGGIIPRGYIFVNPFIDYTAVSFAQAGMHPDPGALILTGEEKRKGRWDEYLDALADAGNTMRVYRRPGQAWNLLWKMEGLSEQEKEDRQRLVLWIHERYNDFLGIRD